ncbi:MAG: peptidoglycan DD-metalloendopeptidase family protein [Fimbriimonadales bacterium]
MLRSALCTLLTAAFILGFAGELPRLVFPVAGGVNSWKPNFGASRDGGARSHKGQDLMAPRMTPLVACFSGTVFTSKGGNAGNWLTLLGDCGWSANYMHLNDDKTDFDDDTAPKELTFAPWLEDGGHVEAGDLIGYVGNSGNAKTSGHHLHFELFGPEGHVDPASYLRSASVIPAPSSAIRPSSYTAPVFVEKVVERPQPMSLAALPPYKDIAVLKFGQAGTPPVNSEHIVRIDDRDVASTGKTSISYSWDTKREADGEHLVSFLRRNIVTRGETVLETRVVMVANRAVPVRPELSGDRLEMLLGLNYYRRLAGLSYVAWDARLGKAADAHTVYWETNKSSARHSAHSEDRGLPWFTGETASERARAAGYPNGVSECMHFVGTRKAVDSLWAVPYHRFALSNSAAEDVGIGFRGDTVSIELGSGARDGVVVFPPDGMTGVPLEGNVSESPAPLRLHKSGSGKVGYVITFANHSTLPGRIDVQRVELRESGRIVDVYVNSPVNDEALKNGAIAIPKSPLRANTTYEVYVRAFDSKQKDISRRWRFTTGTAAQESHTMDYRAAVSRAVNAQPGEIKIRGKVRLAAEDGNAFSIYIEGGEGVPQNLIGNTMWIGMAHGVPIRLGDDPLGVYPVRPDITPGEMVVIIGKGTMPTQFVPRLIVVK